MARRIRSVIRQKGRKAERFTLISVRLPASLWEKTEWKAVEQGTHRSEFVRQALSYATRDARPPQNTQTTEIQAPADEQEKWRELAARHGLTVNQFARKLLNRVVERAGGN